MQRSDMGAVAAGAGELRCRECPGRQKIGKRLEQEVFILSRPHQVTGNAHVPCNCAVPTAWRGAEVRSANVPGDRRAGPPHGRWAAGRADPASAGPVGQGEKARIRWQPTQECASDCAFVMLYCLACGLHVNCCCCSAASAAIRNAMSKRPVLLNSLSLSFELRPANSSISGLLVE